MQQHQESYMIINYLALFGIHGQWYCILCVLHIYQCLPLVLHYFTWHFTIMLHCEKHLLRLISSIFRVTTREKSAQTWIWLQPVNRIITQASWWQQANHHTDCRWTLGTAPCLDTALWHVRAMFDSIINFLCWREKKRKHRRSSSVHSKQSRHRHSKEIIALHRKQMPPL